MNTTDQMRKLADELEALVSPNTPADSISTADAVAAIDASQAALRSAVDRIEAQSRALRAAEDFQVGTEVTDAINAALARATPRSRQRGPGLCGESGCTFMAGHESEHSWGGAS